MPRPEGRRALMLVSLIVVAAVSCTPPRPSVTPPSPRSPTAVVLPQRLPSVPLAQGPLAPRVTYPPADHAIQSRDSNFIFGTIGDGRATLQINGHPVRVWPNGAFLGFVPNPPAAAPRYELVAALGADTARLSHPVRIAAPREPLPLAGPLVVDSGSVTALRQSGSGTDGTIRVSIRAPGNANVAIVTPSGRESVSWRGSELFASDVSAGVFRESTRLVVTRDADTVQLPIAALVDSLPPRWVQLGDSAAVADTDRVIIGRPVPSGTYKWMLLPGTVVRQTGTIGDNVRVRLDDLLEVFVDSANVVPLPLETLAPRRTLGAITLQPAAEWVDVILPMGSRAPFLIEQSPRKIELTLYGTRASSELIRYLQNDTLVRLVNWIPETSDRVRLSLELSADPYGYLVLWDEVRSAMLLRLRRTPVIDAGRPLRGLTLVVDAGHPPGGAIGPTGLTEAEAVLGVAEELRRILEERGARVVMTRTTMDAVDLRLRSVIARRVDAHALLSVHLNAFGDGVNPLVNNGTSTLFFHPQSEPLARAIQRAMVREFGLRDLGVHYQNISIGRTTWMPALITEGLFMMLPDQEYAMRVPEGRTRYARAIADGTAEYFRSLASRR